MVDWALENIPTDPTPYILEVGAGNGNLLFALCDAGYAPEKICGIDYSEDAVKLARAIAKARAARPAVEEEEADVAEAQASLPDGTARITFNTCDFLQDEVSRLTGMSPEKDPDAAVWDFVLDKGTFDAIALAEKDADGRAPADGYPARIGRVVKPAGYFLITCEHFTSSAQMMQPDSHRNAACNFTEDELKARFANEDTGLEYQYVSSFYPISCMCL